MSESPRQPSYRTRNIVLAAIALVVVIAAGLRLALTGSAHPPAQVPVTQPAASVAPPQAPVANGSGGAIDVSVAYRGDAAALPPTTKVYVFIRPVGQRMPLAVQTYNVADLPTTVEFGSPSESSTGAKIEAVARLSLTGAVSLQPGDSEVVSDPVEFGDTRHQLALSLPGTPVK